MPILLLLTATVSPPFLVASPEKTDDNKRRSQRRFVFILVNKTIAIAFPRLDALLLHFLVFFAAETKNYLK